MSILEECSEENLLDREQWWIEQSQELYNTARDVRRISVTPETRLKISATLTGRKASVETRKKQRDAKIGKKRSDETVRKISGANRGKKRTEKVKKRISAGKLGKPVGPFSEEHKQKIGDALRGKTRPSRQGIPRTEETRKKISIANSGKTRPDMLGKPAWNRGKSCSEETRQKLIAAKKENPPWNKGTLMSEEHRQAMRDGWARKREAEAQEIEGTEQ